MNKLIAFLKEVLAESKKVNWPTAKEVLRLTLLVIGISVVLAMFLGGADLIFTSLLNKAIITK